MEMLYLECGRTQWPKLLVWPKVPYFFFPAKVHFHHTFGKNRLDEWKSCFFFFRRRKKKKQPRDRMNEWQMNFRGKKKNTEKTPKNAEKKNTTQSSIKKGRPCPKLNEWPMNFFLEKSVFFFSRFAGKKKNKILDFEWMNEPWTFARKKKNTVPLVGGPNRKFQKPVLCWIFFKS